nr:YfcE family phosphodiesterase [Desulfobacula sp.]
MAKLIVTADLHGSYPSWLTVKALLAPGDGLVIAGDLFDTRFGDFSNPDFQPDAIKEELIRLEHPFYYVHGNCDNPLFFPGASAEMIFTTLGKTFHLSHGHRPLPVPDHADMIIRGHTHCYALDEKGSRIFMNPGSLTSPRNGKFTYGLIEETSAAIVDLKTGKKLILVRL